MDCDCDHDKEDETGTLYPDCSPTLGKQIRIEPAKCISERN